MRYEVICRISQCFVFSTCVSFLLLFSHPSSAPFLWGWHGLCMRTWRTSQRSTSPMRLNPLDISAREHPSHHSGLENPCTGLMVEKKVPKTMNAVFMFYFCFSKWWWGESSFIWQTAVLPHLLWLRALQLDRTICQGNPQACGATPKAATQCRWYVLLLSITVGALVKKVVIFWFCFFIRLPLWRFGKSVVSIHPRQQSVASQTCLFTSSVIQQHDSRHCMSTTLETAWFGTLSKFKIFSVVFF